MYIESSVRIMKCPVMVDLSLTRQSFSDIFNCQANKKIISYTSGGDRNVKGKALLIGNSDGIGLATTKELLKQGWKVVGISRSDSPIQNPSYEHIVAEVKNAEYSGRLKSFLEKHEPIDLCIFCAGIGEMLDPPTWKAR